MTVYIFHHGAKDDTNFYSKFDVLDFLDVGNWHKQFRSDILTTVEFFLLSSFWCSFSDFDFIKK